MDRNELEAFDDRHARPCAGHPRLTFFVTKDVDGRDLSAFTRVFRRAMPGHDPVVLQREGIAF
jgi:hypothetical protein